MADTETPTFAAKHDPISVSKTPNWIEKPQGLVSCFVTSLKNLAEKN